MKTLVRLSGAIFLMLFTGCGRGPDSAVPGTDRLNGVWIVELTELSPGLTSPRPGGPDAIGEIALLHNEAARPRTGLDGAPTHSGTFAIRDNGLGIDMGANGSELVARLTADDSIRIVLQPSSDAPVRMRGSVSRDSIYGEWSRVHARGRNLSGTFIMRRSPTLPS